MPRLHGLRTPTRTACGVAGRLLMLGERQVLINSTVSGDYVLGLAADGNAINCRLCIAAIARRGPALDWHDVPAHQASEAAQKRARRRRSLGR